MSEKLDLDYYKNRYKDLECICKTEEDYTNHWNNYGKIEGRYPNPYIDNFLFQEICGGFGNQLFMILNILSLSTEYNITYSICFKSNYIKEYLDQHNTLRKESNEYKLFKNIRIIKTLKTLNTKILCNYNEKEFKYNKIKLEKNKKYNLNGYFQSYKYFWNYKDDIKFHLNIDKNLINIIKNKYNSFGKKILSIHVRLGDYEKLQDYHPIPPIEYYMKAISFFNLNDYQIILFSDNIAKAKNKLAPLNLNFIEANSLYTDDEEQFYMLMLSNVKICANSSFSLLSCYLNEMYEFVNDAEYIFPSIWFGPKGPKYNILDLKLNYKFYFIDYKNLDRYNNKFDVITTLHKKDSERYIKFIKYNKKYLIGANRFLYISKKSYKCDSTYISEENYPFTKEDVINYIKDYIPDYRWGWYYQQLLKLYIFKTKVTDKEYCLVFDSDILLLNKLYIFDGDTPYIFKRNTDDKGVHKPYLLCQKYILPNLESNKENSGICHFMLFKKSLINKLFDNIIKIHNKPVWKAILDGVKNYVINYGYNNSILSEYEIYYNYIKDLKIYKYNNRLQYRDISYNVFNIVNKENLAFIADHHYQSRGENDYKKDNLMEL